MLFSQHIKKLKCKPYLDFTKINANDQFDVKGSCLSGCYGDGLAYKFNIFLLDNETKKYELFKDTSYFYQFDYLSCCCNFQWINKNYFERKSIFILRNLLQ